MSQKKYDLRDHPQDVASALYILLAVLAMACYSAICTYTLVNEALVGLGLLCFYAVSVLTVFLIFRHRIRKLRMEAEAAEGQAGQIIRIFREGMDLPYAVIDAGLKLTAVNAAFRRAADLSGSIFGADLCEILHMKSKDFTKEFLTDPETEEEADPNENASLLHKKHVTLNGKKYIPECFPLAVGSETCYLVTFRDVSELHELHTLFQNKTPAVGYIVLDNLDELAQYVKSSYQTETMDVQAILRAWATAMNAMLLEYDRNKYILFADREEMAACVRNQFDVLDRIRNIRIGDSDTPITVSMGISILGKTLADREKDALVALDMALLRGGDQVVLKNEQGSFHFGGKTKSPQKKFKTESRVITPQLCSLISGATNVLIMGHAAPDFDSVGAAVGMAALCKHLGKDAKIVMDLNHENFRACTVRLCELADYKERFVDAADALALSSYGTLLIVVDTNNFELVEAPELLKGIQKLALIDHHIQQKFEHEPTLSYVEHSTSSTCEMVSEILEEVFEDGELRSEEANLLLSGIMVDTKNFTRNVGRRTFAAALYLRTAGANSEIVNSFFKQGFADYLSEAQFGSEAHMYRDNIAITALAGTGSAGDRVAAAKAADRLLGVRQVAAAFALIQTGELVHISARSAGLVNVQQILETIGGGGHFDMAGAALSGNTLEEAETILRGAIDQYFEKQGE